MQHTLGSDVVYAPPRLHLVRRCCVATRLTISVGEKCMSSKVQRVFSHSSAIQHVLSKQKNDGTYPGTRAGATAERAFGSPFRSIDTGSHPHLECECMCAAGRLCMPPPSRTSIDDKTELPLPRPRTEFFCCEKLFSSFFVGQEALKAVFFLVDHEGTYQNHAVLTKIHATARFQPCACH